VCSGMATTAPVFPFKVFSKGHLFVMLTLLFDGSGKDEPSNRFLSLERSPQKRMFGK
jgi:hypothetical protein